MRLCRQDDHPQNTKWCPSHRKITWRASKLERKRKICIVVPMVSEFSRVHLSAIPLGEMRTCTFCGSRLRAWYLLVGNPYKPSFATVTGWGVDPKDTQIFHFPFFQNNVELHWASSPSLSSSAFNIQQLLSSKRAVDSLSGTMHHVDRLYFRVLESSNLLGLFECMEGTNISHLGKRKIIFKSALGGDMLGRRRVCTGKHVIYLPWN